MWSRLAVSVNRSLASKSLTCLQDRCIHRNVLLQKYKYGISSKTVKQNKNDKYHGKDDTELNKVHEPFHNERPNEVLFAQNDPQMFGTFKQQLRAHEPDEGDIADDEHFRNIPLRRDQLPQRKYEAMIKKFIREKRIKEAIDVLEVRMKDDRVKPGYYIYQLLIMECGRSGYTKKAYKLYNLMKKRSLEITGPTYAALFSACANTIHPKEGLQYAQILRQQIIQMGYNANEIIYNTMIRAFGRCGDLETAFQLVDEMKEKKLRLKIDTINHLLQVCCSDREYGFRHALYVWHKMYHKKLTPDVHTFNLMMRCTRDCGIGDVNEMKKVIGTILNASLKIKSKKNPILLIENKPIAAINDADNPKTQHTEQSNTTNDLVTKDACDQMPNLLAKLPHLGSIVQLSMVNSSEDRLMLLGGLSGVIAEMEATKVRPNVKTFTQLLDIIPSTREAEHELIRKMSYMRVRADTDLFNLLMKRRILRKDYDGAEKVLTLIDKVNLSPDIATYGIMAMGCVTREQAHAFQEKLSTKGIKYNIEILGALMRVATHIKDYDYVIDVLEYAMNENVQPSGRFNEILSKFKNSRYYLLQAEDNEEERIKYNAFYRVYKKWKSQMNLNEISSVAAIKLLNVHPWKQIKEAEGDGIEPVKNKNTRLLWKRQHSVAKLTQSHLDRLHDENQSNLDKVEQTEHVKQEKNTDESN